MPIYNPSKMMDIQSEGTYMIAGLSNSTNAANNKVSAKSGMAFGFAQWKDGIGPLIVTEGSMSSPSEYEGVPCDGSGGCFINFRLAEQGGETDWGQPATYGAIKQDLRLMRDGKDRPWELGGKGEVKMPGQEGKWKYVPEGQGYGVAKAKAYFHQLDNWSAPPNLFDPFWRAKLHPFIRDELKEVLQKVGDSNGQQIISSGQTAVEGVIN